MYTLRLLLNKQCHVHAAVLTLLQIQTNQFDYYAMLGSSRTSCILMVARILELFVITGKYIPVDLPAITYSNTLGNGTAVN